MVEKETPGLLPESGRLDKGRPPVQCCAIRCKGLTRDRIEGYTAGVPGDEPKRVNSGRSGKLLATAIYGLGIAGVTVVLSVQVIQQAFWPEAMQTDLSCPAGVRHLVHAVQRARQSAAGQESVALGRKEQSERRTLQRFRDQLSSTWPILPTLRSRCASDPVATRALILVERLRYAEEQALRHYSTTSGPLRSELNALTGQLSGGGLKDDPGKL
jgi:hypothetical protein